MASGDFYHLLQLNTLTSSFWSEKLPLRARDGTVHLPRRSTRAASRAVPGSVLGASSDVFSAKWIGRAPQVT